MTKKLLVVAASGLVLAILLLSAAWAIGGQAMMNAVHHGGWHFTIDDDHGATTTRSLAFDSAAPLTIDAPVELRFVRGDHVGMTVSGSAPMVAALRWANNRLTMSGGPVFSHHALKIEIVAPQLPPLRFDGFGSVTLDNLDQPTLQLDLAGAGNLDASGKVHTARVVSSGAGNIDLGELRATDATVTVSGVGNIDVNASGKVNATVSGAGNISLHRKPAELISQISGIGSINQDN